MLSQNSRDRLRYHPFSKYAKFFKKLTFLIPLETSLSLNEKGNHIEPFCQWVLYVRLIGRAHGRMKVTTVILRHMTKKFFLVFEFFQMQLEPDLSFLYGLFTKWRKASHIVIYFFSFGKSSGNLKPQLCKSLFSMLLFCSIIMRNAVIIYYLLFLE